MALRLVLFLLTIGSTCFVGGPLYSLSIISILLAHEMGHYIMSKRYGIPSTLPLFIPFPLSPFGTFGAIIKMKGVITTKRALFDIGVAGPIAGFIVSIPCIVIGIKLSEIQSMAANTSFIQLGDPFLFKIVQKIIIGDIPPDHDLVLHPLGYAGWVGLFVTALNLLPAGQLDGGHIVYALFGERSRFIFFGTIATLGAVALLYNPGWITLVILLLIFGMRHPQPFDTETELDRKRKIIALVVLIIFLLSFTPSPFSTPETVTNLEGIPI